MTDQELLEKAAKAAGYKRTRIAPNGMHQVHSWHEGYESDWEYWDPLKRAEEALALAHSLETPVSIDISTGLTTVSGWDFDVNEEHGDDPLAATRRAIVRAAAALAAN
jgi:hypothetical protein